jgi:hypothetical protein
MHGMIPEELAILRLLEDYGSLCKEQISRYFNNDRTDMYLEFLRRKALISLDKNMAILRNTRPSDSAIKAFEVLIHFKDDIREHHPASSPYTLFYIRGNRLYDVAVINPGDESNMSTAINQTNSERVVAVIEKKEQIDEIRIDKPVLFFIPGNPPKLYEKHTERIK